MDTFERVKQIVIDHLNVEPEKVTSEARFQQDLGADSLDEVELIMSFEVEFSIEIPPDEMERITTVGGVVGFIEKASEKA